MKPEENSNSAAGSGRQLVYLASPYSHPDKWVRQARFGLALRALQYLLENGITAFSPIVHTHYLDLPQFQAEDWLKIDQPILDASSAVYVLCIDGWDKSFGVNWEISYAKERGIELKYVCYENGWQIRENPAESPTLESLYALLKLNFSEYQDCCAATAIYPSVGDKTTYPLMGLAGEVGELLNKVKKFWRDGRGALADLTEERRRELTGEIGDILWYVARVASEFGIDLSEAAAGNLLKLRSRKERGCLGGSGDSR